jgi:hypothetical protein
MALDASPSLSTTVFLSRQHRNVSQPKAFVTRKGYHVVIAINIFVKTARVDCRKISRKEKCKIYVVPLTHYAPVRYQYICNIIFLSELRNTKLKTFNFLWKCKVSRTNIWGATLFEPSEDFTLVVLIGLVG